MDATLGDRDGGLLVLFLDWSKAFDRIKPDAMLHALKRFGLPASYLDMIGAIYDGRSFNVRDNDTRSVDHAQSAGIAQGYPLPPYLFIMMMTVLVNDASRHVPQQRGFVRELYLPTREILYADDTMILGSDAGEVQAYFNSIAKVGQKYGLELNMDKTVLLRVNHSGVIVGSDGQPVQVKHEAVYLGSLLSSDGRPMRELTRRLGEASGLFEKLAHVWKHANIAKARKLQIFDACIMPKLVYSLESLWLLKVGRDRLDPSYARCLRRILDVRSSFVSRVSNNSILQSAGRHPLSQTLLY